MASFIPPVESVLRRALDLFKAEFECCPEIASCAPGRVNLIGEHTDYNEGFVLPMALPLVTIVAGRANGSEEVRLYTAANDVDTPRKTNFFINKDILTGKPKWANYVKGIVANFKESSVPGFDAVIVSSIPAGYGISSSAALEVAFYTFLETLVGKKTVSLIEKGQVCQRAEHLYAGVPCGIMDQLVSIMGRENHALFIDCRTLNVTYVPLDDPDIMILITNSNVKHELSENEYSVRRKQCEEAANCLGKKALRDAVQSDLLGECKKKTIGQIIQTYPDINAHSAILITSLRIKRWNGPNKPINPLPAEENLRDVPSSALAFPTGARGYAVHWRKKRGLERKGMNKTVIARARHVITENKRTEEGARALEQRNFVRFGKLMVESHNSLRDDFDVSCAELNEIVEAALEVDGVYGCRMTGGGFGGCTVTLLRRSAVDKCIANIKLRYLNDPVFYLCKPSSGTRSLAINQN